MPKQEARFLYRPVSSVGVPGFVIDKIGDDTVSPAQTPFQAGFIPDFSRIVISHKRSQSTPQLVQISPTHKRVFEVRYGSEGFIFWADEYNNMYGILQGKGGNVSHPDVRIEKRAPSGFIIWGIQDSDSMLRTVRASQKMREKGMATEAVVRLVEPIQLLYKGMGVSPDEFKRKLVEKVWRDNHRRNTQKEDGWRAVTRADVPRLVAELRDMTFYLSTLGRQVSERFLDLTFISSQEDFQKVMTRVFTFWNTRAEWLQEKGLHFATGIFDGQNIDDICRFFTTSLPAEIARNYGILHSETENGGLDSVHTYPHLGNVSLVGSIYDTDSVYGEPLDLGDNKVTEKEKMDDVRCLIVGTQGFQHAHGIKNLLKNFEEQGIFPKNSKIAKLFSQTFALEYIKARDWTKNLLQNIENICRVFTICEVNIFSEGTEAASTLIQEAFGEDNLNLLKKYYQMRSYGFLHLHGNFPIIVDLHDMPLAGNKIAESPVVSELTETRKAEIARSARQTLNIHTAHLSRYPNSGEQFFSFPRASNDIVQIHSLMKREDIVDFVRMWVDGEMSTVTQEYDPRVIGSFMLALGQLNIDHLFSGIKASTPVKNDPQFIEKLSRICEFFELLPGEYQYKDYLFSLLGSWTEEYDVEQETGYKAAIALFGRGIIIRRLHEIFNHQLVDIISNEFTNEQAQALKEALECSELVDPLMGKNLTMHLLRIGLTGVQVRNGQTEDIALLRSEEKESEKHVLSADLQYFFASEDRNRITNSDLAETMNVPISNGWCDEILRRLIISRKSLHPNSIFAHTLRESSLDVDDIADIVKVALDRNDGDLERVDPTLKTILENKTYEGVISQKSATELVLTCMGFGIDIPEIIIPCLSQKENRYAFMKFLIKKTPIKTPGMYRNDFQYPMNPIYALMSKGVEALPSKIQELFAAHSEDQNVINSFTTGILTRLFVSGYFRYFFGGLVNVERYPQPPFSLGDIRVKQISGKTEYQMWRIVHPDIWNILQLADVQILKDFFQTHLKDGKVFMEFYVFDGPKKGWQGQRHTPLSECLPPDLYQKLIDYQPK